MAQKRKKTTTSKNTKPKTAPLEIQIAKAFTELKGRRIYGCFLVLNHYELGKPLCAPVLVAYDDLMQGMEIQKIKDAGIDKIQQDFVEYFDNAILEAVKNDFGTSEFWQEHSKMITNFTAPLMMLNPEMIELELENDDDRFLTFQLTFNTDDENNTQVNFKGKHHYDKQSFVAEIAKKWKGAEVEAYQVKGFNGKLKQI